MKTVLVVTVDKITGDVTNSPAMYRNIADARRAWGNAIAELSQNNPTKVPVTDLQLYQIGEFDTETLEIKPTKEYLCSGPEFIKE